MDDDDDDETSPGESCPTNGVTIEPPTVAVPGVQPVPTLECDLEALPPGVTLAEIEDWLRVHSFAAKDVAALEAICAELRKAIDDVIKHSKWALVYPGNPLWIFAQMKLRSLLKLNVVETGESRSGQQYAIDGVTTGGIEEAFPCGEADGGRRVLCASDAPVPAGEMLVVSMVMQDDIPLDDPELHLQYAFVFDSDGDTTNNYMASPEYPYDFFQGTDLWYEVLVDPLGAPTFSVKDARNGDVQPIVSAARVVIDGPVIMALIPAAELATSCPGYRSTSFSHRGDYGLQPPYEWNGDTEPTIDQPLEPACEE